MFLQVAVSSLIVTGVWQLPVKDIKTELLIATHKNNAAAVLKLNADCKKPTMLVLHGQVSQARCGTKLELFSDTQKLPHSCTMEVAVLGCGKFTGKKYKTKAAVITYVTCPGKKPNIMVDDVSGTWLKKPTPNRKRPVRKPPSGKVISI